MDFKDGYRASCKNADSYVAARLGDGYVNEVQDSITRLERSINAFEGYHTPTSQLKGDIFELGHSGSFDIDAAKNASGYRTWVNRSHDFASADISSNFGKEFGLKCYSNGANSAKAQATSYFERYSEYKSVSGRTELSFLDYLKEKGIDDESVMHDSIYSGQTRIIPADQLKEAKEFLRWKIAKEGANRPELVKKYQDTLDNLNSRIEAPDGTKSASLTTKDAEEIAEKAKEGQFKADDYGFSTEELIQFNEIIKEGLRSGQSAALISFALKTAPEIIKCIEKLIKDGHIESQDLEHLGLAAIDGAASGFVRGFVSASLTTACKSGALGSALKGVEPGVIAGITVIIMETLSDSIKVASGTLPIEQMADNLFRNVFVTSAGVGMGMLLGQLGPVGYMIGNIVGTAIGGFLYDKSSEAIMSFCVVSGVTFFGLVEQDYTLPDEVLQQLGFDIAEIDVARIDEAEPDTYELDTCNIDEAELDSVYMLRRGVIGFRKVGYIGY